MNIAIDGTVAQRRLGGISEYTYQLLDNFGTVDHTNQYAIFTSGYNQSALQELPKLPKNFTEYRVRWPQRVLNTTWHLLNWPKVTSWLPKHDLFFCPHFLLPAGNFNKLVVTIHDVLFLDHPEWFTDVDNYQRELKNALKRADHIITISEATKKQLIDHRLVEDSKISIIPLGAKKEKPATQEEIKLVREKYQLPDSYLLYVGTIEPRKNIIRILEAYAQLKDEGLTEKLVLAGRRGWLNEEFEQTIDRLKLKNDVILTGSFDRNERMALFAGAKVFLFPSLAEGFGLPVIEAMSAGIPVVTSNISSLPEVAGDAALLIDPYDAKVLAKSIQSIISDENLAKEMIKKGLIQASKFTWEKTATETLKVFEKVLEK